MRLRVRLIEYCGSATRKLTLNLIFVRNFRIQNLFHLMKWVTVKEILLSDCFAKLNPCYNILTSIMSVFPIYSNFCSLVVV